MPHKSQAERDSSESLWRVSFGRCVDGAPARAPHLGGGPARRLARVDVTGWLRRPFAEDKNERWRTGTKNRGLDNGRRFREGATMSWRERLIRSRWGRPFVSDHFNVAALHQHRVRPHRRTANIEASTRHGPSCASTRTSPPVGVLGGALRRNRRRPIHPVPPRRRRSHRIALSPMSSSRCRERASPDDEVTMRGFSHGHRRLEPKAFSSAGVTIAMWAGFAWQTHVARHGHSSVCPPPPPSVEGGTSSFRRSLKRCSFSRAHSRGDCLGS